MDQGEQLTQAQESGPKAQTSQVLQAGQASQRSEGEQGSLLGRREQGEQGLQLRQVEEVSQPGEGEQGSQLGQAGQVSRPGEAEQGVRPGQRRSKKDEALHWYALKVFYNRLKRLQELIHGEGVSTYVAMQVVEEYSGGKMTYVEKPLIPSLMFVRSTSEWLRDFKFRHEAEFLYYSDIVTHEPAAISDAEMKSFQIVTSARNGRKVDYLGVDGPDFRKGERVRVVAGMYKGVEGYIKRVKADRKLLVVLTGVALVAISWVDPAYLEKLD